MDSGIRCSNSHAFILDGSVFYPGRVSWMSCQGSFCFSSQVRLFQLSFFSVLLDVHVETHSSLLCPCRNNTPLTETFLTSLPARPWEAVGALYLSQSAFPITDMRRPCCVSLWVYSKHMWEQQTQTCTLTHSNSFLPFACSRIHVIQTMLCTQKLETRVSCGLLSLMQHFLTRRKPHTVISPLRAIQDMFCHGWGLISQQLWCACFVNNVKLAVQ